MGSLAKMVSGVLELATNGVHWHLANDHVCFWTFEIAGNRFAVANPSGVSWLPLYVLHQELDEPIQTAH